MSQWYVLPHSAVLFSHGKIPQKCQVRKSDSQLEPVIKNILNTLWIFFRNNWQSAPEEFLIQSMTQMWGNFQNNHSDEQFVQNPVMCMNRAFIIFIFCSLVNSVVTFHIPNLDLNTNIEADSSQSNTGLIHSSIRNNWSQSLNVGSVSIAATIVIWFVALCMHLRTGERLNILI